MTTYRGVAMFHSETGTEGGYWAFQDEKFMGLPSDELRCNICGRVWDKEQQPEEPNPSFTYWVDREGERSPEGYLYLSGYMGFDEPHDDLPLAPLLEREDSFNTKWMQRSNAQAAQCVDQGHIWEKMHPDGTWSYEGLHVLHDGDKLTIFSKEHPDAVLWRGEIKLNEHELFTVDAHGMWIHADQVGIDRETWAKFFMLEYPAELVTE